MFSDVKCDIWWTLKDEHGVPVDTHPPHNVEIRWVDDEGFHTEDVYAYPGYNIRGHRPYFLICFGKTADGKIKDIPRDVASEVKRQINNHNVAAGRRAAAFRDRRAKNRLSAVCEAS